MKRLTPLWGALAVLLAATPSDAWVGQKAATVTTHSPLLMMNGGAPGDGSDRYYNLGYQGNVGTVATYKSAALPFAGTFKTIRFWNAGNIATGTLVATLYLNGVATALTCTASSATNAGGGNMCSAAVNVSFTAGQYASVLLHTTGTPGFATRSFVLSYTPTNAGDVMITALGNTFPNTATQALSPFSNNTVGTAANRRYGVLPDAGTVADLWVNANDPGNAKTFTYSMLQNGSASSGPTSCVITGTGALVNPTCSDTSHSFSVTAGDDIAFQGAPLDTSTTAAVAALGVRYVPSTVGGFPLMEVGFVNVVDSTTVKTYYQISSGSFNGASTTEAPVQGITEAMTITKMYIKTNNAPGAGKTRDFTLMVNGSPSALVCHLTGTNTTVNCSGSVSIAAGDLIDTLDDPTVSASPVAGFPAISYLATR